MKTNKQKDPEMIIKRYFTQKTKTKIKNDMNKLKKLQILYTDINSCYQVSENSKYALFRSLLLDEIMICIHEMKKHSKKIPQNFITTTKQLQKNTIKKNNNKKTQRILHQPKYVYPRHTNEFGSAMFDLQNNVEILIDIPTIETTINGIPFSFHPNNYSLDGKYYDITHNIFDASANIRFIVYNSLVKQHYDAKHEKLTF